MSGAMEGIDVLSLMLARSGKEKSRAMPAHRYGDPAKHVEFGRAMEYKEKADQLLQEWHDWSTPWRPALGVPGCAPSCREATTSKQWDSTTDIGDASIRANEMANVEWCVDAIPLPCRQAIGIEMKNRAVKAKVWRCAGAATYEEALEAILPVMRKRGLFD